MILEKHSFNYIFKQIPYTLVGRYEVMLVGVVLSENVSH